jgi:hypothetical protein
MPRFVQPLWHGLQQPDPAGPLRLILRADVKVELRTAAGGWVEAEMMVDTGAAFPTFPTRRAEALGLSVPAATSVVQFETANERRTRSVVRDGAITLRFLALPEVEFGLKCLFRDDVPAEVGPVLGLHNTVDLMTLVFDGTPRPGARMGYPEVITRPG